ncbi:MAG: hypothetical protein B7Y99_03320 [Caulobacterales bacterium 32-69-10]|nr:MAG: hypothetical protein B7Y99_03320 [Caulobacterales bacterium 32-69-10]
MAKYASVLGVALILSGIMAGGAFAAEPSRAPAPIRPTTSLSAAPYAATPPHKQLQWDSKGRWGFRLDMIQPNNRDTDWKDVQAGAFFRITPSMQVGAAVGLGDRLAQPRQVTPLDAGPRVHLETAFRF